MGQVCQAGTCVARPECATDPECAEGFACRTGACRCLRDSACAVNQACLEGRCADRPRCTADADCAPYGRRCEPTQGLCVPPCVEASDCAPGVDPNLAAALYVCTQGNCVTRCLNDATCGTGLYCRDGLCTRGTCTTFSECPQGQYCTGAQNGRCVAYQSCADSAQCPANHT
ncbi:MAG TPA: hypothetical protein VK447_06235, partial [Myxococcaceae bacterium]|nr:hypothetical protein [Myxococcaceae bacterium]